MARPGFQDDARQALPLLEEAFTLLRHAPPRIWACNLVGTGPFILGLVWFWSTMSHQPPARAPALAWALMLTLLHLWMRLWQSRFAALLLDRRGGHEAAIWRNAEWARALTTQIRRGVPAFLALGPACIALIPYGRCCAFYHTLTITAHLPGGTARAWQAAGYAPRQNFALLTWLMFCRIVAFANIFTVVWTAPALVKALVPVEWAFTRQPFWIFETTALCLISGLTYLATDPLVKAVYVLRAFHGLSRASGEDLRSDWRRLTAAAPPAPAARGPGHHAPPAVPAGSAATGLPPTHSHTHTPTHPAITIIVVVTALMAMAQPLAARGAGVPLAVPHENFEPEAGGLAAEELDEQVALALRHPRYDWRHPPITAADEGWLARQIRLLAETAGRWTRSLIDALRHLVEWLKDLFNPDGAPRRRDKPTPLAFDRLSRWLTAALLAAAAVILALLLRRRRSATLPAVAQPVTVAAAPDAADETVTAEALPDDQWLQLAARLRAGGEYRTAARALFLGLLACLAQRDLLALRKAKSNADYLRELRRRTAGHPFDEAPFRRALRLFESGWYGAHPVTVAMLEDMAECVEGYRHG